MQKILQKGTITMVRFTLALVFALVTLCGVTTKTASAQEILLEGPLAGQPAVRKLVQYRNKRFSIGPQFAYTILQPYMSNLMLGAKMDFNIFEWLSIGAVGYYSFNTPTHLTDHITKSTDIGGTLTVPTESNWPSYTGASTFKDQVSLFKGMYLAQVAITPLRGKLALFEKLFVAIDGSFFLGGGIVNYKERKFCNGTDLTGEDDVEGTCGSLSDFQSGNGSVERENRITGTFTMGANFNIFFNNWLALNLEYRIAPYKWNPGGTDESGQSGTEWELQNIDGNLQWAPVANGTGNYPDKNVNEEDKTWNSNQSIAIGFIFYLPLTPKIAN